MFWAFWNDKRKIEKQQKNEICNRNADLPCWWPRICWKTLFRLCSSKVETKNKISTCYTKNIDRILKCLDKLRSNFYKLVNLRLTTLFETQVSWSWIWRLFFKIVDIILQILFFVSLLSTCIINSLTLSSPLLLRCVKVCQLKKLEYWNKEKPPN